jgi:hypothetical protein
VRNRRGVERRNGRRGGGEWKLGEYVWKERMYFLNLFSRILSLSL